MARLLLFCIFNLFVCFTVQDNVYIITAPKLLRLDASETVVVQLFGFDQETIVHLHLKNTLAISNKEYDYQSLKLNAANNYQASATLRILAKDFPKEDTSVYLQTISSAFTDNVKIPVTTVNGFLFIQTDKPLYTPEQEVQVRVYSLNEELRKSARTVTLTFQDPRGVKVEIIDMTDINGAKPLLPPFKIPLKPIYGIWKIVATYADNFETTATAEFEVKEYVLPSISVQIDPEANYISEENLDTFKLKISAKYVQGMPVKSANILLKFGYSTPEETVIIPSTYRSYMLYNGKMEVDLDIRSALSSKPDGPQFLSAMKENTFLYVEVLLQESTGGISQEAVLSHVKFVETPFTLSIIATPPFIKPGLPYSMRVLVKDPLGELVKGVSVTARATATTIDNQSENLRFLGHQDSVTVPSSKDGIAYFTCNIPANVKNAEFTFETEDASWSQGPLTLKAESYVSVNHRYLYIDLPPESSVFEVGQYVDISVVFSYRDYLSLDTFSYQIISKGKVVKYDTVKRVSEMSQSLNIKITPDMVPSARLLVYYVLFGEEKAELVADSTWIDVKAKCVKNLNLELSTLKSQDGYKPKDKLEIKVSSRSKGESLVAFSAVDTALFNLRSNKKDPLKKILQHVEKSDIGCGKGGGKNNADVFDRAGLIFITNANAKASSAGGTCSDTVRPKRSVELKRQFEDKAQEYGAFREYCLSGTRSSPMLETCKDRADRVTIPNKKTRRDYEKEKLCRRAFEQCCVFARNLRKENAEKILLSRAAIDFLMDAPLSQVRSYFPESWLWEEHLSKSGSVSISKTLPDSITTWELKAVGVFNEGICVSDERIPVSQDIWVDVPLPYSMVRGEQILLKGSVYNQRSSGIKFTVTLTASSAVCVFHGAQQGKRNENSGQVAGGSVAMVSFYIMALEAGTHTLTFTLTTDWITESVVKKLRVVPEGIRMEEYNGKRIDPNGVFGTPMRKLEFKNVIPPKIVPKSSVDRIMTVNGEVLGDILSILNNPEGIKKLTNLPRGSAELELMSLLPVYYVYHYLDKTEKWNILGKESAASEKELKRKMQAGITSIMSFQLKNGEAFSMWAKKDKTPSTWVTALIIKTLSDIHEYVSLDTDVLANAIHWLIKSCQNEDGSFSEMAKTNPHKLMGAGVGVTEKSVYLTSYVMIGIKNALKIPNLKLQVFKDALDRAMQYLISKFRKSSHKVESLYVRAIASYALTVADIDDGTAVNVYENIKKQAQIEGNPARVRFWQESKTNIDPLKPSSVTAKSVETTVYVLLNTLTRGETEYAKPILNWLTQDQRYGGGVYSTQDSILTLEALTMYSIKAKEANLNMVVDIEYKTKGERISRIQLTQQKPVAKPIEVTQNDDVIVKTAMSSGVSFVKLKTVYYVMTESNENCLFDTTIDIHDRDSNSDDPMRLSQRIEACAKFKPPENSLETESALTVMEINLPTGVTPVLEDLDEYQNGLESRISSYEVIGDKVVLQIDSIPSDNLYCVGFRIQEEFETGMTKASEFIVYEYQAPAFKCTKLYQKQTRKLLRLCEEDHCQCMAAECCNFKSTIDPAITAEQRTTDICKESVNYALKVVIDSTEAGGDFVTYKAKVKSVLKKGATDDLKIDSEVELIKKASCNSTQFEDGKQYLIMTAESIKIQVNRAYKYKFPLDSEAWVDLWPLDSDCSDANCKQYVKVLDAFEFDYLYNGCAFV